MSTLTVTWRASATLQKQQFVATGTIVPEVQETHFDLVQLAEEERAVVFDVHTPTSSPDNYKIDL